MLEKLRGIYPERRLKQENYKSFLDVAELVLEHGDFRPDSAWHRMQTKLPDNRHLVVSVATMHEHTSFKRLRKSRNPNDRLEIDLKPSAEVPQGFHSCQPLSSKDLWDFREYIEENKWKDWIMGGEHQSPLQVSRNRALVEYGKLLSVVKQALNHSIALKQQQEIGPVVT